MIFVWLLIFLYSLRSVCKFVVVILEIQMGSQVEIIYLIQYSYT